MAHCDHHRIYSRGCDGCLESGRAYAKARKNGEAFVPPAGKYANGRPIDPKSSPALWHRFNQMGKRLTEDVVVRRKPHHR